MPGTKGKDYWVGFDLGGTKMMALVLDEEGAVVGRKRRKTKAQQGPKAGLVRIEETIRIALDDAGVEPKQLAGIGIGSPGPLDLAEGVVLEAPNLGWKTIGLRQSLERALGCPTVVLNDVDAGVYGEYCFGAAKEARCVFGVFPGTGIGGGCVYEGDILRGKSRSCVEIGHVRVLPDGPLCGCGRRGCLETVASRLSIAAAVAAAAYRGDAPYILEHAGTDIAAIRSRVLAEAVRAGESVVERIIRDAAYWLGVAVGGVVHLLSPDVVVLGGGLVESMPDLFLEEVMRSTEEHVMPSFRDTYVVVTAKLGDDATALGAAAWAERTLDEKDRSDHAGGA